MATPRIIVIGASAGGIPVLQQLVSDLPEHLGAAVFVVQHLAGNSVSVLPQILARRSRLTVREAEDGASIKSNRIYVGIPDCHLFLEDGRVRVARGPKENRHRPSIDTLFRSAANVHGPNVIGVVLTGFLDDGTNGLQAIKRRGGIAIVQDPDDAESPGMPQSAVERVDVDYVLPLVEIGPLLIDLAKSAPPQPITPAQEGVSAMPERHGPPPNGKPSTLTCPDCSGALWEIEEGDALTFRCRVGHAYSVDSMFSSQADAVERALWAATRSLEESAALGRRLAKRANHRNQSRAARMFQERAESNEGHARVLKDILRQAEHDVPRDDGTIAVPDAKTA